MDIEIIPNVSAWRNVDGVLRRHVMPRWAGTPVHDIRRSHTGQQQNAAYFGAILTELQNGGYENLLHFLLTYDLGGFDVRQVPHIRLARSTREYTQRF